MSAKFEEKLRAILNKSPSNMQEQTNASLKAILQMGVDSVESLIALLNDPESESDVSITACWLLGQLQDKRAVGPLLNAFKRSDKNLTLEAAKSLGLLRSKRATIHLIKALDKGNDVDKRIAATYSLGLLADQRAVEPLIALLNDKNDVPEVRGHAAEALASFTDVNGKVVSALISCLSDSFTDVRFWSAFALGELKAKKALPKLKQLAIMDKAVLPGWWAVSKEASLAIEHIESSLR